MKYKVKKLDIEAFQYQGYLFTEDGATYIPEWAVTVFNNGGMKYISDGRLIMMTTDYQVNVDTGDFIVRFHDGGIFAMSADDFHDNYELAPQNHIERMEVEASELQAKIDGAQKFLDSIEYGNGPMLCDEQFDLLEKQLKFMKAYLITLRRRIDFDKEIFNAIGVKD